MPATGPIPACARAWLISAPMPAQTGVARLVPPTPLGEPWYTYVTLVSGSAIAATSGTARRGRFANAGPACQAGRLNSVLTPPPPEDQAVSESTEPSAAR